MSFELMWRFEALKIAALEQLQYKTRLDEDELFERAKTIYDRGYLFKLNEWHKEWEPAEQAPKPVITEVKEGYKICPSCNEQVPQGWKAHKYKEDGSPCGHKWD